MPDSAGSQYAALGPGPRRIVSLDVLRGAAILLMIFSGLLPKTLPNWVDHGYNPHYKPDAHGAWTLRPEAAAGGNVFDPTWRAYTWVDLVLPMFLFAMGAAIPQALLRRRAGGATRAQLAIGVLGRWLTLVVFALLVEQLNARHLKTTYPNTGYLLTLVGFVLAFLYFVRWPATVPLVARATTRGAALLAMLALIAAYAVRPDSGFSWDETDTVILVLANTYLVAGLACVIVPDAPWLRVALLAPAIIVIHWVTIGEAGRAAGWGWFGSHPSLLRAAGTLDNLPDVAKWADWTRQLCREHDWLAPILDLRHLWQLAYLKHLLTVVIGTVAGDWIATWARRRTLPDVDAVDRVGPRTRWPSLALATLVAAATFVGLRHYGHPLLGVGGPLRTPWLALVLTLPLLGLMGWHVLPRAHGQRWINRDLFRAGAALLVIGLMLSCLPVGGGRFFEGGISKGGGPMATTLSYHLTSAGLCLLLLVGLITAFDDGRPARRTGIVAANGQNPLMAYYLSHAVLGSLLGLTFFRVLGHPFGPRVESLDDLLTGQFRGHPWMLALVAVAKTSAIALFVWLMTWRRIYWRA